MSKLGLIPKTGFQNFVDQSSLMVATTTTGTPADGTFYSSIINRASIVNLAQDLKVQLGIERIMFPQIYQIQDEFGPNGEPVWGFLNDTFGQLRAVGQWQSLNDSHGQRNQATVVGDYLEVTFYGTGLNLLTFYAGDARQAVAAIDGGSDGANLFPTGTSAVIDSRNYAPNQVTPIVYGLSLGVHTVRIKMTSTTVQVFGVEILTDQTALQIKPGSAYVNGAKRPSSSLQTSSYNSGFDSGVLGTRGGRVLVYQKSDGTIGKAVNPAGTTALFTSSADHSNEEVARMYGFREFGAARTTGDDFSQGLFGGTNRAFTLDDGTTTLVSNNAVVQTSSSGYEGGSICNANSTSGVLTFVGTGLDVELFDGASGGSDSYTYSIDGATAVAWPYTAGNTNKRIQKIVSGLPYGTHTFKMNRVTASTFNVFITKYIVYQPKKPTLPANAIELADYNVMADFVQNTTAGVNTIATGVLRKENTREIVYAGTWSINIGGSDVSGWQINSSATNDYVQYTFYGTGFDFRFFNLTATLTGLVTIDGATNLSVTNSSPTNGVGWTGSLSSNFYGDTSAFTLSTGSFTAGTGGTVGSGLRVSGLTLGLHTVQIKKNAASGAVWYPSCFDIITPIHSHKSNFYADYQNTLPVGSCALSDNRKITPIKDGLQANKNWTQALTLAVATTTTSTTAIPLPGMSCTIKTNGGALDISWAFALYHSAGTAGHQGLIHLYVDGVKIPYGSSQMWTPVINTAGAGQGAHCVVPVSPGTHKVDLYWYTNGGTLNIPGGDAGCLRVREI